MDLKEVVAINLRRVRHAKKMTQEELADAAGLSARYIPGGFAVLMHGLFDQ